MSPSSPPPINDDIEANKFPGTIDVGTEIHNALGKSFVLTGDGWKEQLPLAIFYPLLPFPAAVRSATVHPTSFCWESAPGMGTPESSTTSLALLADDEKLWLCFPSVQPGCMSVVIFEGYVEHQLSSLDPSTLKNHPYASAGLKPYAFNELSQSVQAVYWAPLGARHWVVSLWDSTLDIVARRVAVVSENIKTASPRAALLRVVSGESGA